MIPENVKIIKNAVFINCKKLTIYGKKDSVAESYAKDHNIPFIAVE